MELDTALWLRGLVSDPDVPDDQRAAARDTLAELERLRADNAQLQQLRAVARNAVETGRLLGINFGPLADAVGML